MPILDAKKLWKKYQIGENQVNALAGVSLEVENGDFVAIMGPSGSGKSTLLHILGGLDLPSEGDINLTGIRLSTLDDDQATIVRRHNVGFIFQSFNLLPTLTALENITLPLSIDGKDPHHYQEKIEELLNLVGLSDRWDHKPDQLSGGEQQRVAIARALITEPAIILADEPTGNLDFKTGSAIMELLRRSCDELEQTIIIVTHDTHAAAFADRVIYLRDGMIQQDLTFEPSWSLEERLLEVIHIVEKMQA